MLMTLEIRMSKKVTKIMPAIFEAKILFFFKTSPFLRRFRAKFERKISTLVSVKLFFI